MCNCNKGSQIIKNLVEAGRSQAKPFKWFKDGLSGLVKCMGPHGSAPDNAIIDRRDKCRNCEFATNKENGLATTSQCMAVDPATGQKCGCFIVCKTQIDTEKCPIGKWEPVVLTINNGV